MNVKLTKLNKQQFKNIVLSKKKTQPLTCSGAASQLHRCQQRIFTVMLLFGDIGTVKS